MKAPSRKVVVGGIVALSLLAVGIASASGKRVPAGDTLNPCGDGNMINPAIGQAAARMRRSSLTASQRAQLAALMTRMPPCVPITCAEGYHRDPETGACVLDTPDDPDPGFDPYEPGEDDDDPIVEPFECNPGEVENPAWNTRRLEILGSGLQGAELQMALGALRRISRCVPAPVEPTPADDDDVDDYIKDFPEGNSFYQIKYGDIIGYGLSGLQTRAVTQNMLARELALAARDHLGMDNVQALAWANARRRNTALTNQIYNAISCNSENDYAYGTWGYCGDVAIDKGRCPSSMRNRPGPHGRAIRPLPQHADNLMRLRSGLGLARVVAILSSAQKGNGLGNAVSSAQPGGKNSFPLLWLPGVDRATLASSNGKTLNFLADQAHPPDFIMAREVMDYSGTTKTRFGCVAGGYDGEADL